MGQETTVRGTNQQAVSIFRRGHRLGFVALAIASGLLLTQTSARAQVPPLTPTTTTTTEQPPAPPPTSSPSGSDLSDGAAKAPEGAPDARGDGAAPPSGGILVPPEAQRIINSIRRSAPSSADALLDSLAPLEALGLSREETLRVGLGRFPIAGRARYSHDWLYPRYGPGFRFHLGTDVFAASGTPVRAPVDGVAQSAEGGLGGLTVKVVMPDRTYFYLAHLSGLVEGFVNGMAVSTGDIVGYVGDSGNARGGAPHLHIGIYPHGGAPIDPKPVLDQFLTEARDRVPALVDAYRRSLPAAATPTADDSVPISEERRLLRPMLASDLLHTLIGGSDAWSPELLYVTGASALRGPRLLVDLAVEEIVEGIDWPSRTSAP